MAIVGGESIMYSLHFLDIIQNMLNNVADFIPHSFKALHLVLSSDNDCYYVHYIIMSPVSPTSSQGHLPMVIDWISTNGLLP